MSSDADRGSVKTQFQDRQGVRGEQGGDEMGRQVPRRGRVGDGPVRCHCGLERMVRTDPVDVVFRDTGEEIGMAKPARACGRNKIFSTREMLWTS